MAPVVGVELSDRRVGVEVREPQAPVGPVVIPAGEWGGAAGTLLDAPAPGAAVTAVENRAVRSVPTATSATVNERAFNRRNHIGGRFK